MDNCPEILEVKDETDHVCVASASVAVIIRIPFLKTYKDDDFLRECRIGVPGQPNCPDNI